MSESREAAMVVVDHLHPSTKGRNTVAMLARDRGRTVRKVLPSIRRCPAFTHA